MIRTAAKRAMLLAIATLFAGAAVSCSGKKPDPSNLGTVGLEVVVSPGVEIHSVSYRVSGNGITPITGSIAVADPGATVSILLSGIPAGTGYTVELSGTSTDGQTRCAGSATFAVVAGQTTSVTVALQCRGTQGTGAVLVNGTFNNCPILTSYTAAPLTATVGSTISVAASASDLDMGATLAYAWTATAGTFASASSASTSYTCTAGGAQTLTIRVSDGSCDAEATIPVTCSAPNCGNGTLEPLLGEECEPPGTATCTAQCIIIPVCGNNTVERGEQCDPPNGTTCDTSCRDIPIVCGNGIVQGTEQCDPPNGTTCDQTCRSIAPPRCGDGTVNQPSEECDTGGDSATCTANCTRKKTACELCEETSCDATIAGCASLTGADKTACEALVACMRTSACAATGDAQPCYCGTASDIACLSGQANGACKSQVETAAKSTSSEDIATRFVDPDYPLGRAVNLLSCDFESCRTQCGL